MLQGGRRAVGRLYIVRMDLYGTFPFLYLPLFIGLVPCNQVLRGGHLSRDPLPSSIRTSWETCGRVSADACSAHFPSIVVENVSTKSMERSIEYTIESVTLQLQRV